MNLLLAFILTCTIANAQDFNGLLDKIAQSTDSLAKKAVIDSFMQKYTVFHSQVRMTAYLSSEEVLSASS